MPDIQVELLRRKANGTLVSWLLNDDGTEPVSDAAALVKLEALRALLAGTLSVFVANLPVTQQVAGTVAVSNLPVSQPVTGPLTDMQLRASAVPVAGPLTDLQLRAAPVPVITGLAPLTDAQLRAAPVPVTAGATLPTTDVFATKVAQGKARIGGKQVTTSLSAPSAYFTVENPAGNTRTVYVVGFDVYSDTSATIAYATDFVPANPSVGALFNPHRALSAPSSAVVRAGTTAYSGATVQPLASRITANAPLKLSLLAILPPGQVLGIQVLGAAAGANIAANVFFYEE